MIGNVENNQDIESNPQSARYESHENELGHYVHEKIIPRQDRVQETLETFTSEFNMRLSQEMDSMMSLMHSQINRAISTAITERVIPEIQNIVSSISSSGNRDTEANSSPNRQENAEMNNGFRNKITKKDSQSTGDLRVPRDNSLYTYCKKKAWRKNMAKKKEKILGSSSGSNPRLLLANGHSLNLITKWIISLCGL